LAPPARWAFLNFGIEFVGEIRQNKATRQWVICAPGRGKRPRDFRRHKSERENLPERALDCPFCPGNEDMLPEVLLELPGPDGNWGVRVVPNKFPALVPSADPVRYTRGIYLAMPNYGVHEVVIETPRHNRFLAMMSTEEAGLVIETYRQRYLTHLEQPGSRRVIIFRNHGERAGTSLIHPHSQIIVTGIVPENVRRMEVEAGRYYNDWGRCVYCEMVEFELEDAQRMITENSDFAAFVPFAAQVPFETWIVPKAHQPDFGDITETQKQSLAEILTNVLNRLHTRLGDPDFNYVVNTTSLVKSGEAGFHWHLQIRPRLTTQAGFEIGSGIHINPSVPEDDAEFLRA